MGDEEVRIVVEQEKQQSCEARDELLRNFLKNRDMLSGFIFSIVEDWDLVEETIQEITVYLCSHWNEFTPGTNFGAWIRSIARLRCKELLWQKRRSGRLITHDVDSVEHLIKDEKWDAAAKNTPSNIRDLDLCLQRLPDNHRQIIEMYYLQERPTQQIAEALSKSSRAFYMTLSRIRKRLKACLKHRLAGGHA